MMFKFKCGERKYRQNAKEFRFILFAAAATGLNQSAKVKAGNGKLKARRGDGEERKEELETNGRRRSGEIGSLCASASNK